uniref:Uncharacterized protein n=1 Tax=Bionectria ochroleuca TaxID=29856 RepID=A0A8H7K180_BIOOC
MILSAGPGNSFVNSINSDVPDNIPSIRGASRVSRQVADLKYNVNLTASGFSTDEVVVITVEVLELNSTVAEVTRDILMEVESEPNGANINALTFGFSEASFAHLMTRQRSMPEVEIGPVPFLKVKLSMEPQFYPWYPLVYIDVDAQEIVISGHLQLAFYRTGDISLFPQPVAVMITQVSVRCRPAMVTTTEDTLELQFRSSSLVSTLSFSISDSSVETGILGGGFASVEDFKEKVYEYLEQMTNKEGALGFLLPAYLESRPLPDYWHRVLNMRLSFLGFKYQRVQVHGRPVSYLFVVFSMTSLGLPPPCYCEEQSLAQLASEMNDDLTLTVFEALRSCTDCIFRAFQATARPYANFGHDQSSSTSENGALYASVRLWYRVSLEKAVIESDGVKAVIDLAGEASAKAAIRDKCGHDVLRAGERLRTSLQDNAIKWRLNIDANSTTPREVTITALADARFGRPDITFDSAGGRHHHKIK